MPRDLTQAPQIRTVAEMMLSMEADIAAVRSGSLSAERARIIQGYRKLQFQAVDLTLRAGRLSREVAGQVRQVIGSVDEAKALPAPAPVPEPEMEERTATAPSMPEELIDRAALRIIADAAMDAPEVATALQGKGYRYPKSKVEGALARLHQEFLAEFDATDHVWFATAKGRKALAAEQ
jgi:hypothetical protein